MRMPAKKKTTKKAATKKTTKKVEKKTVEMQGRFDPATASIEDRENYAAYLEQLKQHVGWKIIEEILGDNFNLLTDQIADKIDINGNVLEEKDVDELRIQRNQIRQLLQLPDTLIDNFKPKEPRAEIDYDPYADTGLQSNVLSMSDTT